MSTNSLFAITLSTLSLIILYIIGKKYIKSQSKAGKIARLIFPLVCSIAFFIYLNNIDLEKNFARIFTLLTASSLGVVFIFNIIERLLPGDSSTDAPPPDVSKKKKGKGK